MTGALALLLVDVQQDFLPGGQLAVPDGDQVIEPLNHYISWFVARHLPVFASRDWHPPAHCSFIAQGGPWPEHCVQQTPGAELTPQLLLPPGAVLVDKAAQADQDAYSAFDGTDLKPQLTALGIQAIAIGGLATEYCVRSTVLDALDAGFDVFLLLDGIRGIDAEPHASDKAISEMLHAGARAVLYQELSAGDPISEG